MDNFGSVNDILEFAIAEEMAAWGFYTQMAENAKDQKSKTLFENLALEEKEHREKLENIKEFQDVFSTEKVADLKIADFLVPIEPTPDMDYQSVLTYAMKKENAALKLYKLLADMADREELKNTFLALVEEEAKHKYRFEIEYEEEILKED